MKRVIKNQKKMKNAMYIVFGAFALALFAITRINPSYANDGLIIDNALDAIVLYGEVETATEDENVEESQDEEDISVMNNEGDRVSQEVSNDENAEEIENEVKDLGVDSEGNKEGNEGENSETDKENSQSEAYIPETQENEETHGIDNKDLNNKEGKFLDFYINKSELDIGIISEKTATLIPGPDFNVQIKSLANSSVNNNTYFDDNNIKKFKKYEGVDIPNNKILISTDALVNPVYAWYNNSEETVYYFSEADIIYFNENSSAMFRNFKVLNEIDFHEFDLSRVTNMEAIFYGFGLKKLDLSFMDLRNVTNTKYMFQNNTNVEEINFEGIIMSGLQQIGSNSMFYSLNSLKYVNLSGADFRSLKNANSLFAYSNNLTGIDLSYSNFYSLTSATNMFDCSKLEKIDLNYAKFSNLTTFGTFGNAEELNLKFADFGSFEEPYGYNSIFGSNVKNIDLEGTNLGSVSSMKYWFQSKNHLERVNFSGTVLTNLTDMSYMFQNNNSLSGIDFSNTDLSNVTTMEHMFSSAEGIRYVNFSGNDLRSLKKTKGMFNYATNLYNANFHAAILTGIQDTEEMFNRSSPLLVDFGEAKFGATMNSMFKYSYIQSINLSGADFSLVNDMSKTFYYIPTLKEIDFTNIVSANNITNMSETFYGDQNLTGMDLSMFDLSKVTKMEQLFRDCSKLEFINFGDGIITLSGSLYSMFEGTRSLTQIDLSNFDTTNVTNMARMFAGDNLLKTIYVSDKFVTANVTSSGGMFNNTQSIVGGNGTVYSGNKVDGEYARIDTDATPGYFTNILDKEYSITYYTNGGVLSGEKTIYTQRDSFTLPIPIKTGYIFLGRTGSNGLEPEITVNIQSGSIKGDLEYTANWGIGKYKIILDTDGGNEINSIEKNYNSLLSGMNLPIPTKECNAFSGRDIELPETMPAHDITLKAVWDYTCSKSSGGGGAKKTESTTRETAVETQTENEHNSADEQKSDTPETSNTPANGETTSNQVISVTQEVSEDGTIEAVVETIKIKNTDIVATVRTEVASSTTSNSSSTTHTREESDAYSFAKSNGITTTSSIDDAKMNTELTRIQMAKMLSNFAINVLGQEPDPEKGIVKFDDVTNKMDKQYDNAVTKAYQLGIMGQNVKNNEFRPNDTVTRAEFASALSRLLYDTEEGNYKGTGKYYVPHVAKLYNEGIINKADPKIKEKRGYVMTMLKRTVE